MMKIRYSKAFMEKFGKTVLERKNEIFIERLKPVDFNLFDYLIDWKTRKRVNLIKWLDEQVTASFGDSIVEENGWKNMEFDKAALSILRWVKSNYTYVGDLQNWDCDEKWASFPVTILVLF